MVYQVNAETLGVNALLQMIDILYDGGLYDSKNYPWHTDMIDMLCKELEEILEDAPKKKITDVILGISRIPIEPVLHLINQLIQDISEDEFLMIVGNIFAATESFDTITTEGLKFLTENDPSCGMVCRYLQKCDIEITAGNMAKEIAKTAKTVISENNRSLPLTNNIWKIKSGPAAWTSFLLTTNTMGADGPSKAHCLEEYKNHSWVSDSALFDVEIPGIQVLTIPKSGTYQITAYGASHGLTRTNSFPRTSAAIVKGLFYFKTNSVLEIAIGQNGIMREDGCGGTFVMLREKTGGLKSIIVAGGAGGTRNGEPALRNMDYY